MQSYIVSDVFDRALLYKEVTQWYFVVTSAIEIEVGFASVCVSVIGIIQKHRVENGNVFFTYLTEGISSWERLMVLPCLIHLLWK